MAPLYLDVILLSKSVRNCSLFDKALAVCAEEMGGMCLRRPMEIEFFHCLLREIEEGLRDDDAFG